MTSLVQRTRAKKLAQKAAANAGTIATASKPAPMPEKGAEANEYQALLALQESDLRTLSDTQSIEARNPIKRDLAEQYRPWVEGALAAGDDGPDDNGKAAQDEIVVTQMIWAIDYRDFDYALAIAEHVLKFGLALPERYNRTAGCVVAEEIATVALKEPTEVSRETLDAVNALTDGQDMPDPARAKLIKALGIAYDMAAESFDPKADNAVAGGKPALIAAAISFYERALKLHDKCGVKKRLEQAKRALDQLNPKPEEK